MVASAGMYSQDNYYRKDPWVKDIEAETLSSCQNHSDVEGWNLIKSIMKVGNGYDKSWCWDNIASFHLLLFKNVNILCT